MAAAPLHAERVQEAVGRVEAEVLHTEAEVVLSEIINCWQLKVAEGNLHISDLNPRDVIVSMHLHNRTTMKRF